MGKLVTDQQRQHVAISRWVQPKGFCLYIETGIVIWLETAVVIVVAGIGGKAGIKARKALLQDLRYAMGALDQ